MSEDITPHQPNINEQLQQLTVLVRDMASQLNRVQEDLSRVQEEMSNIDKRLQRVEARLAETSKLDKILGEIADLREELSEFKAEVRREFRDLKVRLNNEERERLMLEKRIDQRLDEIEDQIKPKQ
jgi:chromosome segregation ATPase